jgi:hypothetical protein
MPQPSDFPPTWDEFTAARRRFLDRLSEGAGDDRAPAGRPQAPRALRIASISSHLPILDRPEIPRSRATS